MFELVVELSKKLSQKGDEKSSPLFLYFLLGPLLLIATLSLALFKLHISPQWDIYWTLGCIFSLSFGLLITALSFHEGSQLLSELVQSRETQEEENLKLQQLLEEMKLAAHHEKEQAKQILDSVRSQLKEAEKRAESFEELTMIKKYEWEALEEEKEALFQEKVSIQQDLDVLTAENSRQSDQLAALQEESNTLRKELTKQEAHPPPHPYDELRKQFDEKSDVLNATRKELFAMEGKYLAIQKDMEDKLLEPHHELQELLTQFNALEAYCTGLEDDLARHQELLTELSVKKPVKRKRKTTSKKVKVDEAVVSDLFTPLPKKTKAKAKIK